MLLFLVPALLGCGHGAPPKGEPLTLLEEDFLMMIQRYDQIRGNLSKGAVEEARTVARFMAVTAKSAVSTMKTHDRDHPEGEKREAAKLLARVAEDAKALATAASPRDSLEHFEDLTATLREWRDRIGWMQPAQFRCQDTGREWLQSDTEPGACPYSEPGAGCAQVSPW